MKRLLVGLLVSSCFLGGCASMLSGSGPQTISIMTEPANVDISIVNTKSGDVVSKAKSPFTAVLERQGTGYNVLLTLPGYLQEETEIKSGIAGWYWGNVLWGYAGIVGILIDGGTGAMYTLDTQPIKVKLYQDSLEGRMSKAKEKYNGLEALKNKDYDNAINATTAAISLYPEYAEAFCTRGAAYASKEDYEKSIKDYNKAISIKPDYPNSYCERGGVYFKQEKNDIALADFNKALSLKPDYAEAMFGRGLIYQKQNDMENAKNDLKLACSNGFSRACNYQL